MMSEFLSGILSAQGMCLALLLVSGFNMTSMFSRVMLILPFSKQVVVRCRRRQTGLDFNNLLDDAVETDIEDDVEAIW